MTTPDSAASTELIAQWAVQDRDGCIHKASGPVEARRWKDYHPELRLLKRMVESRIGAWQEITDAD